MSTGSFMIRGKKNYLPPSHLILGFGILFKLGDDCLENHKNERRVRTLETEVSALSLSTEDTQSTVCYLSLKSKFFLSFLPFYYVRELLVQRKANDLIFISIHFKMRWVEIFSLHTSKKLKNLLNYLRKNEWRHNFRACVIK